VDPVTRGDPESALRWTTKSTTNLAVELTAQGHKVSPSTVAKLLRVSGYSLQANAKAVEGKQHPDRDAQFEYLNSSTLNSQALLFTAAGDPVISVDAKRRGISSGTSSPAAGSTNPSGNPGGCWSTTAPTRTWEGLPRAGCTTSLRTPGGSTWAPTPIPGNSMSSSSAAGGTPWAATPIPVPTGC